MWLLNPELCRDKAAVSLAILVAMCVDGAYQPWNVAFCSARNCPFKVGRSSICYHIVSLDLTYRTCKTRINIHVRLVGLSQSKFGTAQRLTCEISDSQDMFMTEPAENIWELLVTGHRKVPLLFTGGSGVVGKG
jgi:hypothetical protein